MGSREGMDFADPECVREMFLRACKVGAALDATEVGESAMLAEVLKKHLHGKARRLVQKNVEVPMLFSYQSDATSYLCQTVHRACTRDQAVTRRAKVLEEFLMERGFLHLTHPSGRKEVALLVGEPRTLAEGKKAWNLFAAAADFFPLLRQLGHRGVCVFHFGSDRAMYTALDRMLRHRRQAYYTPGVGPDLGGDCDQLRLTDFYVSTGCAAHDVSNGLKWAFPDSGGAEIIKDLHIAIESLRNSYRFLHMQMQHFLTHNLAFSPPAPVDDVCNFWKALGIDPEWLDLLVHLDPHWHDGKLRVSRTAQDDPSLIDDLSAALLYIWRWRKFSETRWCGLGVSCRSLVAALVTGLDEVVAAALSDPNTSNYHLGGFRRLSPAVRRHAVLLAVASYPAEALLLELLTDDRVARRAAELKEVVAEEMEWLEGVAPLVWERLDRVCAEGDNSALPAGGPAELRSDALLSAHVACAYIHNKLWRVVDGVPWSLAEGDIKANLLRLRSNGYQGTDLFTKNLSVLLAAGFNLDHLVEAVRLLQAVPWTTVPVEQAHGSMAVLHRFHPMLTRAVLTHRTVVHQCRALFHRPKAELRADKLTRKANDLDRKVPSRVGGQGMFLQELFKQVEEKQLPGTKLSQSLRREIVQRHGGMYRNLSAEEHRVYDQKAREHAQAKVMEVQEQAQALREQAVTLKRRLTAERLEAGLTNRLCDSRFGESDLLALGGMLSEPFASNELAALRHKAQDAPRAPTMAQQGVLESCGTGAERAESEPAPAWVKTLCDNRDAFQGCAVGEGNLAEGSHCYLFLFASRRPLEALFLKLRRIYKRGPYETWAEFLDTTKPLAHAYDFDYLPVQYLRASDLTFLEPDKLFILEDIRFTEQGFAGTDSQLDDFTAFCARFPKVAPASSRAKRTKTSTAPIEPDLFEKYPWLRQVVGEESQATKGMRPRPDDAAAPPEAEVLAEDVLEAAWRELLEKRHEQEAVNAELGGAFTTKILGGAWTRAHKKKAFDAVVGIATGGAAKRWCRQYGLNVEASFSFQKYGNDAATALALEWCRRMSHFYEIFVLRDDAEYCYTKADIDSYEEDAPWLDFLCAQDLSSPVWARAELIRCLRPKAVQATTSQASSSKAKA